jgi:tRNA/rRNA methyltransferase
MRIPTGTEQPSMNLGQAVAVVLYELIRAEGGESVAEAEPLATAEERERLVRVLVEALRSSGYRQRDAEGTEEKVRRLVGRMGGTAEDLREWLGVWRRVGR